MTASTSERDKKPPRTLFTSSLGTLGAAFTDATGNSPLDVAGSELRRFAAQALVAITDERVRLTPRGLLLADTVMAEIV